VTLDDQIAQELERIAYESRKSFKSVVNEVLRAGLENKKKAKAPVFRESPAQLGLRREFEGKLNQLADELWSEDFAVKGRRS